MPETKTIAPKAQPGLRFVDVAFPHMTWEVVQTSPVIYIRRDDGLLYHHDDRGWRRAWMNGWFSHVDELTAPLPSQGRPK